MRQRSDDRYGQLLMLPEIRFAHAAVSRLHEPAPPLVTVCGPAGSGKTHLTRHIVREIRRQEPHVPAAHVTASEFSAEFAKASKTKSIPHFQESYRSLNLLVCEDLQSLEGRLQTQQQFLAVMDAILAQSGRILLTSSKSLGSLSAFSSRLRNRCLGGVCAAIESLGPASREKLLTYFAGEQGIPLPDDIAQLLAASLTVSARELRGAVLRLELLTRQHRKPVNRLIADRVIHETLVPSKPTLPQISKVVAKAFSVSVSDLRSQRRLQGYVLPRQLAMFIAREWSGQAYSEIGRHFHRRSHSTIVHACERVRLLLQSDEDFCRLVEGVRERLNLAFLDGAATSTTS
ncbi:MAG: DnaA/Hda family protein [Planctomycetaceae bacterium]